MKTTIKDGKTYAKLADLKPWEKNPKDVTNEDYARLESQYELGEYKPLLVMGDGVVLGGNTRQKLYNAKGVEEAWISPIEFKQEENGKFGAYINGKKQIREFESQEQAMIEYALSDNDQVGRYNSQSLAELVMPYQGDIKLEDYKIDIAHPVNIQSILDALQPPAGGDVLGGGDPTNREQDEGELDSRLDTYLNGTIRQIVLYFTIEEYQDTITRTEKLRKELGFQNNTETFLHLLNFYEDHKELDTIPLPLKDAAPEEEFELEQEDNETTEAKVS